MKIVRLTAENIKKIRAVEITPEGEIVTIAGKNGQGKTSVLDSIWWALAGTANIQKQPIRKGEQKARVRLDLGELIVERKFTETGSTLFVESAEGARYPSPQKMLDALIGELSFDPLAFARMDPAKQFDELRRVSKLDVDIVKLDGLNRRDYAKRTEVNRDAKAKRAAAAAIIFSEGLPTERIDEKALLDELQEAAEQNATLETRKARRDDAAREITTLRNAAWKQYEEAKQLRERADALYAAGETKEKDAEALQAKLDAAEPLPAPTDLGGLRMKLDVAQETNLEIGKRERRQSVEEQAAALEAESKRLTEEMEARETAKRDAIMAAKPPVDGLGFGDGVVTYNGVPFEQASSAEQLRVSLAIAMAANPKLRVIRIEDGSLLDEESLAQIASMAKAADYQVWIERVDDSGKVGIVIEDGMVRGAEQQELAEVEA